MVQTKYYIKFKANGVAKEYYYLPLGNYNTYDNGNQYYSTSIQGSNTVSINNKIIISLNKTSPFAPNFTYTNYTTTELNHEKTIVCQIMFFDENGAAFISYAEGYGPAGSIHNTKFTVTETTAESFKGRFSGTVYLSSNNQKIDLTDGVFYVER